MSRLIFSDGKTTPSALLYEGPWRGLPGTEMCMGTDHPEDGSAERAAQPVAGDGPGPRSCGQPVVGPAFQGPAWHVGNVLGEASAFQRLKGKCSRMGWWVVGGGTLRGCGLSYTGAVPCQGAVLIFLMVLIDTSIPVLPSLLPGRPAPQGLSITRVGTLNGH